MQDAALLTALNADLNREYHIVVHYLHYVYSATGRESGTAIEALRERIAAETRHADWLARVIVALGGQPVIHAPRLACHDDPSTALARALAIEHELIAAYEERCEQTTDDPALRSVLADMLADERAHAAAIIAALDTSRAPAEAPPLDTPALTAVA